MWKNLSHLNVLPFVSAAMVIGEMPEKYKLVSEFMKNGSINEFIEKNEDTDRLELVGFDSPH